MEKVYIKSLYRASMGIFPLEAFVFYKPYFKKNKVDEADED